MSYHLESARLESFQDWPLDRPGGAELARAGFHYTTFSDKVKCNFCGIVLGKWREFDNPLEEHKRWSPNCPFVENPGLTNNVSTLQEECGRPIDGCDVPPPPPQCKTAARLDTFDGRYETFRRWPRVLHHLVNALCSAGLHYNGQQGDLVYCYACDGGIQDWEMTDDPWIRHAREYGDCPYVLNVKGSAFVEDVQNKRSEWW